jgi:Zn finger protein HypA/HybF involved in hydrogenase expression
MKAKCFECHWKGEVESPEIKSCPLCGGKLLHYIINTSQKEVIRDEKKAKTKSKKVG